MKNYLTRVPKCFSLTHRAARGEHTRRKRERHKNTLPLHSRVSVASAVLSRTHNFQVSATRAKYICAFGLFVVGRTIVPDDEQAVQSKQKGLG